MEGGCLTGAKKRGSVLLGHLQPPATCGHPSSSGATDSGRAKPGPAGEEAGAGPAMSSLDRILAGAPATPPTAAPSSAAAGGSSASVDVPRCGGFNTYPSHFLPSDSENGREHKGQFWR